MEKWNQQCSSFLFSFSTWQVDLNRRGEPASIPFPVEISGNKKCQSHLIENWNQQCGSFLFLFSTWQVD